MEELKKGERRAHLMVAVPAGVEEHLLVPVLLGVQDVVAAITKYNQHVTTETETSQLNKEMGMAGSIAAAAKNLTIRGKTSYLVGGGGELKPIRFSKKRGWWCEESVNGGLVRGGEEPPPSTNSSSHLKNAGGAFKNILFCDASCC
ncbi:hypothetical protein ACP70R_033473 [Stipagrostis hirtigluma subsp. patula]